MKITADISDSMQSGVRIRAATPSEGQLNMYLLLDPHTRIT